METSLSASSLPLCLRDSCMSLGPALAFGGFGTLWSCDFTCALLSGLLGIAGFTGAHCAVQKCGKVRPPGRTLQRSQLVRLCVCKCFIGNAMLLE